MVGKKKEKRSANQSNDIIDRCFIFILCVKPFLTTGTATKKLYSNTFKIYP